MKWDSYESLKYRGRRYGMKSNSFRDYIGLPEKAGRIFDLVAHTPPERREELERSGWVVRDPRAPTRDPWTYQQYIQQSKAEFSVAKQGYVISRCGWFSERSANYLASGRPVVVQDTGFSDWMDTGSGVLPFSNPHEAVERIAEANADYEFQCRAARAVAEEYFDARRVLPALVQRAMNARSVIGEGPALGDRSGAAHGTDPV